MSSKVYETALFRRRISRLRRAVDCAVTDVLYRHHSELSACPFNKWSAESARISEKYWAKLKKLNAISGALLEIEDKYQEA